MTESDGEQRTLQVPEGLGGERVDVALARMFGISRSKAAELVSRELVQVDGRAGDQVRPADPRNPCSTSPSPARTTRSR